MDKKTERLDLFVNIINRERSEKEKISYQDFILQMHSLDRDGSGFFSVKLGLN